MRKKFVAGNWKMNMLGKEAGQLARGVAGGVTGITDEVDVVLAPPFTALRIVAEAIEGTGIGLGAQDVFWEEKGPYTGEISPAMLVDAGCEWVIIGHSERRNILHETDEMVRKKINAALAEGLKVIVCVGETLEEKEGGKTVTVVDGQVESALSGLEIMDPSRFVIAYEPIWAIGTGQNATPDEAEFVHATIREIAGKILGGIADRMRIVYGGSVTEDNITELMAEPDIDGALVGGASLRADAMTSIVLKAGE
ncbi:MAG: triose-phosphate isomerase [Candidatus Dadabacteria bacterium]